MLIQAVNLLLSLSILVVIHEFGHFIAARMFKTRVEKFYLFFDFLFPIPTLLNFALFKKKIGDTEYGIGWFPLGGYVKIAGMMDESADESFINTEPKPDEYRSKKNWQKLIIMLGGIIMNVLLAWVIYSQLLFWQGESILPSENVKYGISCDSVALYAGFRDGDIILSHDRGIKFESMNTVPSEILLDDIKTVEVLRDGQHLTIKIPDDFIDVAVASHAKKFIEPRIPFVVGELQKDNVVEGKLQRGDIILSLNDSAVHYFQDGPPILSKNIGKDLAIKFLRGTDTLNTTAKIPATGFLGFTSDTGVYRDFTFIEKKYNIFSSFSHGIKLTYMSLWNYLKQFKLIFHHKAYKSLGGIGTIGSLFGKSFDWTSFWHLTAFLSIMLAVANLLPIPMLDGGYVMLLLIEMTTGKQLGERTVEYINRVGFIILIALMLYANGMDIFRAFFQK